MNKSYMNKNKLFLTVILIFCALTPMGSMQAAQPAAPARQGVAMGVLSDMWGLSKWICRTGYNAVSFGNDLWNRHMSKEGFYAIVGVVCGIALYNWRYNIEAVRSKYKPAKKLKIKNDAPQAEEPEQKLCVDLLSEWDDHVNMRANENLVLAYINSQRNECKAIQCASHKRDNEKAQALKITIKNEMAELKTDIENLENQFLVFFKLIENLPFGWKALGIEKVYKQTAPREIKETTWSIEQYHTVNTRMKQEALRWWHPLCLTLNYGNAAYAWWELKKLMFALELVSPWIDVIAAGNGQFPDVAYHAAQKSHAEATGKFTLQPR